MKTSLFEDLAQIYSRPDPAYAAARRWRYTAAFSHTVTDFAGNAIISALFVVLFVEHVAALTLGLWFFIVNLPSLGRNFIRVAAQKDTGGIPPKYWRIAFSMSLIFSGAAWGWSFFAFPPAGALAYSILILVFLAGCAAWVVAAYAVIPEGAVGWLATAFVPIALYLTLSPELLWRVVALGCFTFVPCMAAIALRNNVFLLRTHIVQFENQQLTRQLIMEKRAVDDLNESLQTDIKRRERIESELRQAKERAEQLALELEKLSSLDGLTAIANRRRFDHTLEREWNRAARGHQHLSLVMCDIDFFKQYNDQYGHQAGDACLRQLASLLESCLRRGGDLAARYGGEEFAILLPDTGLGNATLLAEAIRERLQVLGLPHEASSAAPVLTASFGVATKIPNPGASPSELVSAADKALYQAKAGGRNRVVAAGTEQRPHLRGPMLH